MSDSDKAFPIFEKTGPVTFAPIGGFTKRQLFAAIAMQGMIQGLTKFTDDAQDIIINRPKDIAEISCVYADALLAELEKKS